MSNLATQLRNAVLSVLMDNGGPLNMSADDYAFLNIVSTYGQSREAGGVISAAVLSKVLASQQTDRTITSASGSRLGETGPDLSRGDLIPTMPPAATLPEPANPVLATAPDTSEMQENLPLGTADRGPEPQDPSSLLSTEPPVDFDPSDPPPDYTRLETAATRRVDA